ncbi:hypothetical protein QJS04_geneDACA016050 [Acorus gramineus]|uniref:UspA domain-containing protein n=1 Tax=Acorus gramineus TaxID=55184 RepID=A0AAV9BGG4_ACOGR|nr:hypothetical protein QJS04_geneDACA016050 [Acorus gramineus]
MEAAMASSIKNVIIIGIDDNDESTYSLEWTLDHLLVSASRFRVVFIHVKVPAHSVLRISGPGVADVMSIVEKDQRKHAAAVEVRARELCLRRQITDYEVEVVEGDPRTVLCDAVDKHHADVLVVGSHGYGKLKRVILGSVSDYCAHHAHCSVLIVKKPKINSKK